MSSSNCCFLTCIQISQEAGQMVWYSHLFQNFPQFVVIHTVKFFGTVNKAEIDDFLELSCFCNDPVDVGNLISGSSAFSKTSLNIWKFMVHILLKPGLEHPLGQSKSRGWNQNPAAGKTPCPCIPGGQAESQWPNPTSTGQRKLFPWRWGGGRNGFCWTVIWSINGVGGMIRNRAKLWMPIMKEAENSRSMGMVTTELPPTLNIWEWKGHMHNYTGTIG